MGLKLVLVRINEKVVLGVNIVVKMKTQKILVGKYTGNLSIGNKDSTTIEIVVIKPLLIIKERNFKGKNPLLVELST